MSIIDELVDSDVILNPKSSKESPQTQRPPIKTEPFVSSHDATSDIFSMIVDEDPLLDISATKPKKISIDFDELMASKSRNGERSLIGGGAAALGRFTGKMVQGGGGMLEAASAPDGGGESPFDPRRILRIPQLISDIYSRTRNLLRRDDAEAFNIGGAVADVGKSIAESEIFRPSKSVREGGAFQPTNLRWWVERGLEFIPLLASQVALAYATRGQSAARTLTSFSLPAAIQEGGLAFQNTREALIEQGEDEDTASSVASDVSMFTAIGSAFLDRIAGSRILFKRIPGADKVFTEKFLSKISSGIAGRAATGFTIEGGTEIAQEAWADAVQFAATKDPETFNDWQNRYAAAGSLGGLAGAAVDIATGKKGIQPEQTITQEPTDAIKEQETAQPDVNVQQPQGPIESKDQVPTTEGGEGIREGGQAEEVAAPQPAIEQPTGQQIEQNLVGEADDGIPKGVQKRGSQFAEELLEATRRVKATARHKKLRGDVIGQFKRTLEKDVIEVGDIRNQRTMAHELGHAIDYTIHAAESLGSLSKRLGITGGERKLRSELKAVSWLLRGDPAGSSKSHIRYRNSSKELMADYMAMLVVDPAKAKELAPTFTDAFEANLAKTPEIQSLVNELKAGVVEPTGPRRPTRTEEPIKPPGQQPKPSEGFELPTKAKEPRAKAAVQSLIKEAVRTKKAEVFTAFDAATKWEKNLTESQLEDIGAVVEGIGNLSIKGDTGQAASARMTPAMKQVLKSYRFNQELSRQKVNQFLEGIGQKEYISYLDDYIAHFYVATESRRLQGQGRLLENSPNAKNRKLPTLKEGVDAGLVPITQNVATLHKMWAELNWRVATNRFFLKGLREITTDDGIPVIVPVSQAPSTGKKWPVINHPSIARTFARKMDSGATLIWRGGAAVHPDIATEVRIMLNEVFRNGWVNAVETVNAWAKKTALSFSFFHHIALTESSQAVLSRWWNPIRGIVMIGELDPSTGQRSIITRPGRIGRRLMENHTDTAAYAIKRGLQINATSDINVGKINRQLRDVEALTRNIPGIGKAVKRARQFNNLWDRNLWDYYHSGLKMFAFYDTLNTEIKSHPEWNQSDIDNAGEKIAHFINNAFGGQEWETTFWLDPKARQIAHWTMLAPDWTWSNIKIGSETLGSIKNAAARKRQFGYWRRISLTLLGATYGLQAAVFSALGDEEKGDKMFMWDNEKDHTFDIDITPLHRRLPWNDPKDKRRHYVRLGKQARELLGWVTEPITTFMRKTSPVVQIAFEQAIGTQTGGFDMPFSGKTLWESAPDRLLSIGEKFVPFSWQENNFAFALPLRKGMGKFKGKRSYEAVLEGYANPSIFPIASKHPDYLRRLKDISHETDEALILNGLKPKLIFRQALSSVRAKHYSALFKALEDQDKSELAKQSKAIVRLHAGMANILTSAKNRQIELTREDRELMRKYISDARKILR